MDKQNRTNSGNVFQKKAEPRLGLNQAGWVEKRKFKGKEKRKDFQRFSLFCGYCYHFKGEKHCISGVF